MDMEARKRTCPFSLSAQSHHRVYARRLACGDVTGEEGKSKKQEASGCNVGQVAWGEAEEHAGDKPSCGETGRTANRDTDQREFKGFAQNHPANASLLRAQCDA